jgi:hypothetical protein
MIREEDATNHVGYWIYCGKTSVADPDPDPVGSGPFLSDPDTDPDVWDRIRIRFRIRIRALINDFISTFLVCIKAIKT